MLLPVSLLAETVATTPTESVQPAEPSTLVLALIGLGTFVLYQLMIRNKTVSHPSDGRSNELAESAEKPKQRAA